MAIYTMAGFYLLYLAFQMFGELKYAPDHEKTLMIVFMIFFVLVGGGMMVFGIWQGYKIQTAKTEEPEEEPEAIPMESANTAEEAAGEGVQNREKGSSER